MVLEWLAMDEKMGTNGSVYSWLVSPSLHTPFRISWGSKKINPPKDELMQARKPYGSFLAFILYPKSVIPCVCIPTVQRMKLS